MTRIISKSPTLFERLAEQKKRVEAEAIHVGPGPARNKLLEKLRELDAAAHINEWLSSPGLQSPR